MSDQLLGSLQDVGGISTLKRLAFAQLGKFNVIGDNHGDRLRVQFQIDIPDELALEYSKLPGGIGRAAVEALALEGVRSGRLTDYQARVMLGISTRFEMDGFLRSHGVLLPDTLESVIRDSEIAAKFVR